MGLVQSLIDVLEAGGVTVTVHDEIKPDPTVESIEAAVKILKENNCDSVLALGGDSCIDAAKVIAVRGKNDKTILKMAGLFRVSKGMLPLYAVPTTAGTGSEVTTAAVALDPEGERKLAIVDPRVMPRAAALDGTLMLGLPPHITAATGMDALTHAVEAYVSKNALRRTDKMAVEAVQLIMTNLETAVADGKNVEARQNMARASRLAGKAFTQVGLGYLHGISHNFGALYHIPPWSSECDSNAVCSGLFAVKMCGGLSQIGSRR
jgi:alcohol dehydrogenase